MASRRLEQREATRLSVSGLCNLRCAVHPRYIELTHWTSHCVRRNARVGDSCPPYLIALEHQRRDGRLSSNRCGKACAAGGRSTLIKRLVSLYPLCKLSPAGSPSAIKLGALAFAHCSAGLLTSSCAMWERYAACPTLRQPLSSAPPRTFNRLAPTPSPLLPPPAKDSPCAPRGPSST